MQIDPRMRGAGGPTPGEPIGAGALTPLQKFTNKSDVAKRPLAVIGMAPARPQEGVASPSPSQILSGGNNALKRAMEQDEDTAAKLIAGLLTVGQTS